MSKTHYYKAEIKWTGNLGPGTLNYKSYDRSHTVSIKGKNVIQGSSDPAFLGDLTKHSPEDLLVASLSACHMLWYLHLCSAAGVIVVNYLDRATGNMVENSDGSGSFSNVTLNPEITVSKNSMIEKAIELHSDAGKFCFIANSVNFPVYVKPVCNSES